MPKQVVVNALCDFCYVDGRSTPGNEVAVSVRLGSWTPGKPNGLVACDEHELQYLKPLLAVIEEYGETLDQPAKAPKKSALPTQGARVGTTEGLIAQAQNGIRQGRTPVGGRDAQCLWCPLSYSSDGGSGINRHLRIVHGFEDQTEAFGGPCPMCDKGPYDMLGAHSKKAHKEFGFTHPSQLYLWARDNGDPYGHYASALERKGSLDPEEQRARYRKVEKESAQKKTASAGKK